PAALQIAVAKAATKQAPTAPARMPLPIHRPRPGTHLLPAMTMPTTSAASSTSRKTIRADEANTGCPLLRDDPAFSRILVELSDDLIATGLERLDGELHLAAAGDDLLEL